MTKCDKLNVFIILRKILFISMFCNSHKQKENVQNNTKGF